MQNCPIWRVLQLIHVFLQFLYGEEMCPFKQIKNLDFRFECRENCLTVKALGVFNLHLSNKQTQSPYLLTFKEPRNRFPAWPCNRFLGSLSVSQPGGIDSLKSLNVSQPGGTDSLKSISSLGRYVFGSEISYNKAPPRLPGLGC